MWRGLSLLIFCCAVRSLAVDGSIQEKMLLAETDELRPIKDANSTGKAEGSHQFPEKATQGRVPQFQPTVEPLEDELENQENIISQLLGDYDKVKTVSSGSDCVCRCVVRPIKQSDCSHVHESDLKSPSQDFYTVETITKGTDCKKCVCMAPPSAVNPCEGEYRFKKLQEASKDDIKLATIIDLLEGSLYGMDLLKLHSVTTKLLTRVDNIEKAFTQNLTERMREKERVKERAREKDKEKKIQLKKKKLNDERSRVKSGGAAYAHKQKNYDSQLKTNHQQDGVEEQNPIRNQTETRKPIKEKTEPKQPMKDKNTVVIRGVTFYKAEEESYKEDKKGKAQSTSVTTKSSVDLQVSEQLPRNRHSKTTIKPDLKDIPLTSSSPSHPPTAPPSTSQQTITATQPVRSSTTTPKPTGTTQKSLTTRPAIRPTAPVSQYTTSPSDTNITPPIGAAPTSAPQSRTKSRLSWTESPADQPAVTKKPGVCKDTVASISEPVQKNTYGLSDGAWMRDARGHGNVIYLTNGHYGNNLLEFRDMDTFKLGQTSNSYKLPYSFTGTGHVVFNGAFYYNRAFSRDIIRYDLRHRYVAAWTTLHDALLEEQIHRTQTEVEFAVDESGLWLLYPALDTEGFHQEVILLIHLHPRDLQPIQTFRTGLRRGRYGNSFLLHTEMDQGDNAVKYTLSGEGVGSVFTIDQVTGDIHAQVVLDREKKSYYTLKAQAVDVHTGIPLEPESEFIIKVQDINDNEPQFPDGPYSASVPEMSPAGTYVTQVTATDADDPTYGNSARIVYSILHGQPYFSVDPKTGIIRTALANMDREVKEEYQVLLQAKDMGGQLGGLASTTIINITLTDVNDNPPRFTKSIFHLHVPESASLGAAVGRIQAQDLDVGSNARVDFAIVPGDEGNMFDIISNGQSQEGIVVLKKTLDYETQASYTFKVEAFNAELDPRFLHLGPFKDSVTVKINVLDVDEPPVFTTPYYSLDVYEDTPPGTIIGSVTAYDLDASSSAVRYSLEWQTGSDSFFDIETVEGTLSTNEYLDRETAVQHNITVVATKLNNPSLSAEVLVKVNVLDVNEFPPQLTAPSDTFVCENSRAGQVIQTVSAVDEDHPPVGQRFFFKSSKELQYRNFTVRDYGNNTAGIVTRQSAFQRRLQDVYVLPVVVEDSGYPAQSSTATLTIRVCSCETVGSLLTCSPVFLPADLSTEALLAVLLSITLLIGMSVLYMGQRPQKVKDTLMRSKEDIRDNVIHYDDEGGGEADTDAFHMGTLCKTYSDHSSISNKKKNGYGDGILLHLSTHCDNVRSPDIHLQTASFIATGNKPPLFCHGRATQGDAELIREVIEHRLKESQQGYADLPGDSLATYAHEGDGSEAQSLSSIEDSLVLDSLGDFSSLADWGQPFKTLASILDKQPPSLFNES